MLSFDAGAVLQAPPRKQPDIHVPHARAWRCSHPDRDMSPASVEAWLLRTDPRWAYWLLGAISLDPARGFDRRALQFPEATHEFSIWGLDLSRPIPEPDRWENAAYLEPAELKLQVELHAGRRGDAEARVIVGQMVMAVVEGQMSPEVANRAYWIRAIQATVKDFRDGRRRVRRSEW